MLSSTKYKRGEIVQNILIVLVISAMIFTGIGIFFGSLATNYPSISVGSNAKYAAVMANASAIYSTPHDIENVSEGLREAPDTQTGTTGLGDIIPNAFGLVNFVQSFFTAIITMTGLPLGWAFDFILLLAIVMIAFAVVNFMRGGSRGL